MTDVKPLDISFILRHAFLSGVVAARNIPGHEECDGPLLWLEYDPGKNPSLERIWKVLYPETPMNTDPLAPLNVSIDFEIVQHLSDAAHQSPWVPLEYTMNDIVADFRGFLLRKPFPEDLHKNLADSVSSFIEKTKIYENLPVDRGGSKGTKGMAFSEMKEAFSLMSSILEKIENESKE